LLLNFDLFSLIQNTFGHSTDEHAKKERSQKHWDRRDRVRSVVAVGNNGARGRF